MFKPFKEAILYCRDREAFEYGDGTKELECCRIIFSTNLAGRGTDIKLCKQLVENGGLHVVVAFLPDNVRVEEQAFGRAARCGEPGTAQLVVCNEEDITSDISRMKIHRNAEEVKRIQTVTTFYENTIKVEEECFGNFADRFKQLTEQMDETEDMDEAMKQLLSRDILDQWADWLDSQPREGQDNELGSQNDAASWLFDLIDAGVFEHSNINFKGLNDNLQSDGLFNKLKTATGMSNKSGSNVENVLQNVKGQLSCLIRPTDSGSSKRLANSYEKIDGATAASSIEQQFKAKAGVDKFETVDAKLVALWDRMAAANLVGLRDTSLLMVHGATHIIEFMEQAYSAKTLWKIALVAGAALIQLAAGSAVMICTAGSGVFLSKFLISEGISDLIFAIKGACTGHVGSYAQHKITSMIASGIMCGAAAWMAHGSRFNSVGHGLFGSGMTTSAGVNYSALKGGALIAKAGLGNTIWEAVKQVAVQAAHAVLNLAVFTALQKALQYLIEAAIQKAREYILSFIGQATESVNHLRRTIFAVFKEFGLQRGHKLVDECGSYVLQAKSSTDDWVGKACDFIFKEYRHLFLGFCSGLQQGMSHGHSTNAVVTKALQLIPTIFMVSQLTQMSTHIISRITSIHIEINHLVETDFGAKKKALAVSTKPHPKPEECSEKDINAACDKVLQSWQKQLEKEVDAAIHQRIATPLLAMLAAKVQGQIESAIKNTYHKVMEWRDEAKIHQYKAEYEKERGAHGSNEKDAWKHYEEKLTHLMQTTRSPEVFKDIIASGAKIDMTCASAAGAIISHILHDCPVRMIVTDENGNKFTHQTAGVGEVREVEIDLRKEHYGDQQYQTGQNSCLFDAISCKVPEFGNAIHNDGQFRQALGHVLTTDPYYQLHIESGWQSIAVQQDHIGGKIHKVHYGQEDFHDAPERLDKNIAAVSKVKGGFSPHLERDDQGRTLSAEGTIRGWKQTGDGKVDGDQAKGTSAGKNVPAGMMEVDGKKVDDRGHIIPKSWGGSGLDPGNVFPQNKTINRGQAAYIDKEVAQFLKMGPEYEIKFRYDFIYGGDSHRPTSVHRQIDMYKDNKLMSTLDVNEANWDTTTPKPDSSQKEYVYRRKDNPR
uniref:Uncharacterized protein n=1 Tax=Plectus sambesii TaxID=2011161 RepID=A0A914WDZ7_9BILA